MSDSSYKLTTSSRRKSPNRRPVRRPIQTVKGNEENGKRRKRIKTQSGMVVKTSQPPKKRSIAGSTSHGKKKGKHLVPVDAPSRLNINRGIPPLKPVTGNFTTVRVRKQGLPRKVRVSRKTRLKPMARTILYALRLLIVGVGIGAIMGTVLSVLDPADRMVTTGNSSNQNQVGQTLSQTNPNLARMNRGLFLSQEILPLKSAVGGLLANNTKLTPGIFLVDLDSGNYVDFNAAASFPAASTIKIPILVAFFQDVDKGKIRLDEQLTMEREMMVGGSGDMRLKQPGTKFTALEVATKMMVISDNTATNMLIQRMGGMDVLNQRFRSWGLSTTTLNNLLPDLEGTNTTSPKELGALMAMVGKGNLVTMRSRDRIIHIMRRNRRNHLLPAGLPKGSTIAHKTGDIGSMLADAGFVDLPTGKRYLAAVMVQRPHNDSSAETLIKSVSRVAYQQFSQVNTLPGNGYPVPGSVPGAYSGVNPRFNNKIPNTSYPAVPQGNPQYYPYQR